MQRQRVRSASDPTVNPRIDERIELRTLQNSAAQTSSVVTSITGPATVPQNTSTSVVPPHSTTSLPASTVPAPTTVGSASSTDPQPLRSPGSQRHESDTEEATDELAADASAQENRPFEPPTEPLRFNTYAEYLSHLSPMFPDIRTLRWVSRTNIARISVIDRGACGFFNAEGIQDQRPLTGFQNLVGSRVPDEANLRIVLVEDIDSKVLVKLGAHYDLDPEFFVAHLELSDHARRGSVNDEVLRYLGRFELTPNFFIKRHNIPHPFLPGRSSRFEPRPRWYVSPTRIDAIKPFPVDIARDFGVKTLSKSFRSPGWYRPVDMRYLGWRDDSSPLSTRQTSAICRLQHWEFEDCDSMETVVNHQRVHHLAF